MYVAMDVLKEQNTSVVEVTNRLGYQSDAAFSRAFKRVTSVSPVRSDETHRVDATLRDNYRDYIR
jgi:AraC-like DNA-binding protein